MLFGPSAVAGAHIPALCDLVITLEALAGARMHCEVSGRGDLLATDERQALALCRRYLSYLPRSSADLPPTAAALAPDGPTTPLSQLIPADEDEPFDMRLVIVRIVDAQSFAIDVQRLASELVIDAVIPDAALRSEIGARLFQRAAVPSVGGGRKHLVHPM